MTVEGRLDIALCYGTRPQVIKASVLRRELGRRRSVSAIDTGQHYDYALNELLYSQLGVSPPNTFLEVGSGSHADQTAAILVRCEKVLGELRPRVVVVIGDTNSTLGATLAATKLRIPVAHVEAGLRVADHLMAEEINRRVVDSVATVLCAPSQTAVANLSRERPGSRIVNTGDVARDVLLSQLESLPDVQELVGSAAGSPYVFCTLHRAELTEKLSILRDVLMALGRLPATVVLAMHPRTRAAMGGLEDYRQFGASLRVISAVGYLESLALIRSAKAVITDSGGVQREAYWLGVPCVTLRTETEWVETIACGANQLVSPESAGAMLSQVTDPLLGGKNGAGRWERDAYGSGDAAQRVTDAVNALLDETR